MSVLYVRTDLSLDCTIYQNLVAMEGGNIDDYIRQLSQFLKDRDDRLNEEISKMETVSWTEIPAGLFENVGTFLSNNTNKTIHNALFVMSISFFEWAIVELCRLLAIYIKDDFLAFKGKGQGIFKAKNYLKEKLDLSIGGNSDWQLFTDNHAIRNLIVHNGSNIIKDYSKGLNEQPDEDTFKRNKEYFEYTETGFIFILKMRYIIDSHSIAKSFIQQCLKDVLIELAKRNDTKQ